MSAHDRALKVLHVASFAGNIGDLANHAGARRLMREQLGFDFEFENLEIREFYWGKRRFDDDFVDYANHFDLLLIGGGNYFELWVDRSATGTSIDISAECLSRLKVPTVFFALGVDTGQGYSALAAQRFSSFMTTVLAREDMFVCVRNDGSSLALREVLGESTAERISVMPDGGFFADSSLARPSRGRPPRIGINIAGDMLDRRFSQGLAVEGFLAELSAACIRLLDTIPSLRVELIPHIWRDSVFIAQFLPMIPDPYLRRRVIVGTLDPTHEGLEAFLNSYRSFDLVLGMRFHANVCPIGMRVPSRGLLTYPQVKHLYDELGMTDRLLDVSKVGFGEHLAETTFTDLSDSSRHRQALDACVANLQTQARRTLNGLRDWLETRYC